MQARRSRAAGDKIARIVLAPVQGRFHKFVAMNSYDERPKGHTYRNTLVRVQTAAGVEGVGVLDYSEPDAPFLEGLRGLLGADPLALYEMRDGRVVGRSAPYTDFLRRYKHLDGPLFDLVGKLTKRPCWRLIGDAVRDRVEVYDGTLYFSDIWFRDRGVPAVVEEAVEAKRSGYLGMKFKVGRGWKWMALDAGLERDVRVLEAARDALGPDVKILADANNGYRDDFERAWELLRRTRDARLYWMEEIFPDDREDYLRLRRRMAAEGVETLLAEGENAREADQLRPLLEPDPVVEVTQMDIRRGGFLDNLASARMAARAGVNAVPHNWGSQVGLFMGLHLAKAVENVIAAEDDRSTCDALVAAGYEFREGRYRVSDAPGLGLRVDADVYRDKYQRDEIVVA